ncbi:L-type lectin-domain containing receptor kinase IX.1-like [Cucurbita pepo subsp. pepo]|uniref:L-type lectin-domain containing receptor kinase IX.1-like n=1 Tax=Cucurbita pepo subsp. pepo TaxID=3664 RepID=UPI000C9DA369|nr:L-type lectin-domain containing receptor kinase IX.1-like [Cucurbita pepo subsp. pepo]XP_023545204.1 L-type lectin-domain containing receptor kinase IX.1-like [Cucurbita pepo subsp. pepo]
MASHRLFFLLFLFLSPDQIHSISFKINDFDSHSDNMVYHGDAKPLNGSISFNGQLGWATYAQSLRLCDHSKGHLSNFKTHFSFLIPNYNQTNSTVHSNGLAFFLAPSEFNPPLNSSGSFLGLYNSTRNESFHSQIVHLEFEWDPPFQHMGINRNSIVSSIYSPWNSSDFQKKTHVWISYNATAKNLSVSLNNNATLSHHIDLLKILPEKVTIGFSTSVQNLSIEFWEFSSSDFDANYEENDDNLHMEESEKAINMKLLAVLIAWVGVFVIAILAIFVVSLARSGAEEEKKDEQQQHAGMKLASIYSDLNKEASSPRRFSYRYLAMATDNFSMNGKLGQGGFGTVFKGHLPGANKTVAVKRSSNGSMQGKREYVSEVKIISHMRHNNLVQLIGWCHERDNSEFLLVYEFMPNGSLDSHLFGKGPPLPWPLRYKISLGLASALLYLHEEWEHSVIHRDIKSSNVLLDFNFTPKLGDFGLARLAKHELNSKTPGLVGTFGYMAPEYISSGRASKESDIFSFGVVLLEIVSGRKCCDHSGKGLIEMVWDAYGRGEVVEAILDEKLREGFVEVREVERLSVVGLWSAHPDAAQRPSIKQVIQVLSFEEAMPNLPKQMPLPTFCQPSLQF